MGIAFGIIVLVLLVLALRNRRRERRTWVAEERYDDSGTWLDKRSGERGTYGSRDAEMEAERFALSRQGRINDLALEIRNFAFEHVPGFHERSDVEIKNFFAYAREEALRFFAAAEALQKGVAPQFPASAENKAEWSLALKKRILDFAYENLPRLLDLNLDAIQLLDRLAAQTADRLAGKMI